MSALATVLARLAKDLTPADVHVATPAWPRKKQRKLAQVLLKLAGVDPGLYVARCLTPECDARLRAWAAAQHLPALDANLHVTVVYSRTDVPWTPAETTVAVPRRSFLRFQTLGPKAAVVLAFRCPSLHSRWSEARRGGATWDYGSAYLPHLTLYYGGPVPASLPPFDLEFGPEVAAGLEDDAFACVLKAQEHGPDGRFLADTSGAPLVVYHGTASKFEQLRPAMPQTPTGVDHPGIYFSGSHPEASNYATRAVREGRGTMADRRVIAAHLAMERPYNITRLIKLHQRRGMTFGEAKREALKGVGPEHDGVIFEGNSMNAPEYIVFSPTQVHPVVRKAFDEAEHPREHGRFVHGAGVAGPLPKGEKRTTVWLDEHGQPLDATAQAHLTEIAGKGFNAPNYAQQTYYAPSPGRKGTYVGTVVDGKGRSKRFYLDDNEQQKYAVKTKRVRQFADGYEAYSTKLDAACAGKSPSHDALALRLLTKTGMRPGSDRDTKAAAKAFGATNMPTSACSVKGTTVTFKFPAKNGKTYTTSVTDGVLAAHVVRQQRAGAARLFDTNETKVRALFKHLTGNAQLQLKDIRTAHGTSIAQQELMAHAFQPATEREFAQLQKTIATKVATALQNTPKVALEKYILDGVWHGYRPGGRLLRTA